jgi:hypothetical protein
VRAPDFLPLFYVQQRRIKGGIIQEIRGTGDNDAPGEVIASARIERLGPPAELRFLDGSAQPQPVMSCIRRNEGADGREYDVFDERDEAIGFLRVAAGTRRGRPTLHLSAPYLDATGEVSGGLLSRTFALNDDEHPVLKIVRQSGQYRAVGVTDRRLAFRLAAAAAVIIELDSGR